MTAHKYTDEEITKALECCAGVDKEMCHNCPLSREGWGETCIQIMARETFSMISRQKAEIERLQRKEQKVSVVCNSAMEHYDNLYEQAKEMLKAEAIKEFANRLRSHYPHTNSILKRIDCIEKEMIEEAQK